MYISRYYKEKISIEIGTYFFFVLLIIMLNEKNAEIFVAGENFLTEKKKRVILKEN